VLVLAGERLDLKPAPNHGRCLCPTPEP